MLVRRWDPHYMKGGVILTIFRRLLHSALECFKRPSWICVVFSNIKIRYFLIDNHLDESVNLALS